jgi:NAD(P)-dependent dehydrogenase (short-subunit alcohol dehydrogenase family)
MSSATWTAADLPNLTGKTVIVTGANSGIGLVAAREFAHAGARVILAVRNVEKGKKAAESITRATEVRELDVSRLASIHQFAARWDGDLDILVNNAGIMLVPEGRTEDGFELHMGTNYLGPFALTNLLLPHMRQRPTSRVVTISSQLHKGGRIDPDDLNADRRKYKALQAYRDSKLADILFTEQLQLRLDEARNPVRAMNAHPGIARTSLNAHVRGFTGWLSAQFMRIFNDVDHGAYPTLYAATQDIPGGSYVGPDGLGHFRGNPEVHRPGRVALNQHDLPRQLWDTSERITGVKFPG